MFKIEYEIVLNKSGRPCIGLPDTYEEKPEDKFFTIEMARYTLEQVYARRSAEFDPKTSEKINISVTLLQQIGDEVAELLWENMKLSGDAAFLINNKYHIQVKTIEERNNLNLKHIYYDSKIFVREEGLKVLVTDEMKIYELKDGITNENWNEVK
jgi:hypothetical protein